MAGDLYEHDILEWSEQQAERLRRVSADERYADADWPRIIEEIAAVGIAQLNDVRGALRQAMLLLIKIHLHWNDGARPDWELELGCTLDDAADQFTASMQDRIDLALMWERVRSRSVRCYADDPRSRALPDHCPWSLATLLANDPGPLLAALAGWPLEPMTF